MDVNLPKFVGIGRKEFRMWRKAMYDAPIENLPKLWKVFEKATEERKHRHFRAEMLQAIEARLISSLPLEAKERWQIEVVKKKGKMTFEDVFSFYMEEVE